MSCPVWLLLKELVIRVRQAQFDIISNSSLEFWQVLEGGIIKPPAHNTSPPPPTSPMRMQNIPNEFLYIYMKKNICEKCIFIQGTVFVVRYGHVRSFYSLQCNKNSIWKSVTYFVFHCYICVCVCVDNYIFSFGFLSVFSLLFTFITWPCRGICRANFGKIFRLYTSLYALHIVPALFNSHSPYFAFIFKYNLPQMLRNKF